jgi:polyhydroxyalkanoate synthesis regulator phasin
MPNLEWRKSQVIVRHLPALKQRVDELERQIAALQETLAEWRKTPDR